ncbi:MAG: pyridoxine 5'-phosphate synthase [Chitinophagaceae bacterium]|nr:MAG: pyridoxine 5'-phosphate synthase [Chitinophagaceae bacterium]
MKYCKLSVNINKVALIRNSRGGNYPDIFKFAEDCERFGAEGITVHPRPDERHIRYSDLEILSSVVNTELNIEGYPSEKFLTIMDKLKPHQVTLVPDSPEALTSDNGWDIIKYFDFLKEVNNRLHFNGIRVSLFVNVDPKQIEAALKLGIDRIELYTGPFAEEYKINPTNSLIPFKEIEKRLEGSNLRLNAGHDLNLYNLAALKSVLPSLEEVSIGHALVSDALYYGIENTIGLYKRALRKGEEARG